MTQRAAARHLQRASARTDPGRAPRGQRGARPTGRFARSTGAAAIALVVVSLVAALSVGGDHRAGWVNGLAGPAPVPAAGPSAGGVVGAALGGPERGDRAAVGATAEAPGAAHSAAAVPSVFEAPAVPARIEHPVLAAVLDPLVLGGPAGSVGVSISADDGTPVYAYNAHVPLIPASTEKSIVAAAALLRLGPDHRYRTDVLATTDVDVDGILDGTLVLVGSGDPTLGTPAFGQIVPARPRTPLEDLADQIVAAGVVEVTGGVLGDPSALAEQPLAPGWGDAHVTNGWAGRVAGLTVDGGRHVYPVGGGFGSAPVDDPAARAADALRQLLVERGVVVSGPVGTAGAPLDGERIAAVRSAPLAQLLAHTVQTSDNHLADGIFRTLGIADGDPTWTGAARATRAALADLPLRWDGVSIVDGSGLSRQNRVTPDFLADLAAAMGASDLRDAWGAVQAVTGERGTLRNRMVGTAAQGRVFAKTGTLTGVRALSGTVEVPGGGRYHFAVIGNDLGATGHGGLVALQDLVAVALVEDLVRCTDAPDPVSCAA